MSWSAKNRFVVPAPVELQPGRVPMPRIGTLAQWKAVMINAPEAVEEIVSDADELPAELVKRLARADTIVAPRLARLAESPVHLERALKHTRTLLDAGVRLASFGDRDALTEWRLLAKAGLTPRQVLESATVHAARVARSGRRRLVAGWLRQRGSGARIRSPTPTTLARWTPSCSTALGRAIRGPEINGGFAASSNRGETRPGGVS
jgi:hypothetical protein